MQDRARDKGTRAQTERTLEYPGKDRAVRLKRRLAEMHDCKRDGLDQNSQFAVFLLQTKEHESPEEEFPGKHVEQLDTLVYNEVIYVDPRLPEQRVYILQIRKFERNNKDHQHDRKKNKHFLDPLLDIAELYAKVLKFISEDRQQNKRTDHIDEPGNDQPVEEPVIREEQGYAPEIDREQ